jgi:hypothetical protein
MRHAWQLRLWTGIGVLAAATLGSACGVVDLSAQATDTWTRHYTLKEGGTVEIRNTNGKTEVLAGDGDAVDVSATKVARAMSDERAKDALGDIHIDESVSPDHIGLDTRTGGGIEISVSRHVDYVVHLPRWANVELGATNGEIKIRDVGGALRAQTTNGVIDAESLGGRANVSATNGRIALDFARIGDGDITCDTTNGAIRITVPTSAKATVDASVTNGGISMDGLDFAVSDKSRRHLEGTLNGGGSRIKLSATNGAIAVRGR